MASRSRGVTAPASASQALSRLRTLVVPTATTRPPRSRVSEMAATVRSGTV